MNDSGPPVFPIILKYSKNAVLKFLQEYFKLKKGWISDFQSVR